MGTTPPEGTVCLECGAKIDRRNTLFCSRSCVNKKRWKTFKKHGRMNYHTIRHHTVREGEMTHTAWKHLKSDCRECAGSYLCPEHKKLFERVEIRERRLYEEART